MEKQENRNLQSDFDSKLNLHENNFTFLEYNVTTKISKDFKIFLPQGIISFIIKANYFFSEEKKDDISNHSKNSLAFEFFKLDEEKLKSSTFSNQLSSGENKIDLTENIFIQDIFILKSILSFFGSINKFNEIPKFSNISEADLNYSIGNPHFIEKSENYQNYLQKNIEIIFNRFKLKDLTNFTSALKYFGIELIDPNSSGDKGINLFYNTIKNFVLKNNKILITVTPSNNFWIKTERVTIGTVNYDKKINNYNFIFYNWKFIKKFYERIGNHPRCQVGYLNSMLKKNLEASIDSIQIMIPKFNKNYLMFDQSAHDNINTDRNSKPNLVRNMEKIISVCKSKNYEFNETNIVILESERDKANNTKSQIIELNVFSEEYILFGEDEKKKFEQKIDKVLDYLETLLNECDCDVREYLAKNPLAI